MSASPDRLPPAIFRLPVEKIRAGWYTDAYFNLAKGLLEAEGRHATVTMQVFQKHHAVLGGIDEAIAVLKECAGTEGPGGWELGWDRLEVHALHEGDEIEPWETVMHITGDYSLFAHLETVYLGCLARRTRIMRNWSALGARELGFHVTLALDATRGVDIEEGDTERSLERMRAAGVVLGTSAELAAHA